MRPPRTRRASKARFPKRERKRISTSYTPRSSPKQEPKPSAYPPWRRSSTKERRHGRPTPSVCQTRHRRRCTTNAAVYAIAITRHRKREIHHSDRDHVPYPCMRTDGHQAYIIPCRRCKSADTGLSKGRRSVRTHTHEHDRTDSECAADRSGEHHHQWHRRARGPFRRHCPEHRPRGPGTPLVTGTPHRGTSPRPPQQAMSEVIGSEVKAAQTGPNPPRRTGRHHCTGLPAEVSFA